ncbi:hypothetical protein SAY87_011378 [Trapa incisa]|uniref:MICOS complex subunit MIC10 n=1 Tax=Trapa incisa TaxID=236973 RepID=A0AAN7GJ66_9MYRT|nr:hypothetical protein SAY87_011378 [Trapa incisa]
MVEEKRGLKYDASAKWDECVDLSVRRFVYSSLAGAFGGLLLFRTNPSSFSICLFDCLLEFLWISFRSHTIRRFVTYLNFAV